MEVYFVVLDDSMLAMGQEIYHSMFDNTDDLLLASIDKEMLWQCIEMLCKIRKIEWKTPPSKDGVNYFPFPVCPEELWQVFNLMEPDRDYGTNMEKQPRRIVPSEMSAKQINARLTWIQRGERFCDGNIAAEVENGNLLKMLLRLDDLLKNRRCGTSKYTDEQINIFQKIADYIYALSDETNTTTVRVMAEIFPNEIDDIWKNSHILELNYS